MRYIAAVLLAIFALVPLADASKPILSLITIDSGNMWNQGWIQVQELRQVWIAGFWIQEIQIIGFRYDPFIGAQVPVFGLVDIWIPGHFEWRWVTVWRRM